MRTPILSEWTTNAANGVFRETVPAFAIERHNVTNGDFLRFCAGRRL